MGGLFHFQRIHASARYRPSSRNRFAGGGWFSFLSFPEGTRTWEMLLQAIGRLVEGEKLTYLGDRWSSSPVDWSHCSPLPRTSTLLWCRAGGGTKWLFRLYIWGQSLSSTFWLSSNWRDNRFSTALRTQTGFSFFMSQIIPRTSKLQVVKLPGVLLGWMNMCFYSISGMGRLPEEEISNLKLTGLWETL